MNKRNLMKILHINSYYSSSSFYKNLFDKQIENGLDIDVYVPIPTSLDLTGRDLGSYTTISQNHSKYDRYIFHLKHSKIYQDIITKYNIMDYSIMHAHSLFSNGYIALRIKEEFGLPYIVAVRNTDVNVFFKYMIHLRKLGERILENADRVIFLSKPYRDYVIKQYVSLDLEEEVFNKSSIIPNGIDDFWFENKQKEKKDPYKQQLKLLFIGDLDRNKNVLTTSKAIKRLLLKSYDIKFTVVGRIINKDIYHQIKELEFINYISPKPMKELLEIYRGNDIFVMPSIAETFGLVYAEAMSQGLPVIYSKGQGFDGQFEDGVVGYSVNSRNPTEIAEAIAKILENYNDFSSNANKLSAKFNWNDINIQYQDIYEDFA